MTTPTDPLLTPPTEAEVERLLSNASLRRMTADNLLILRRLVADRDRLASENESIERETEQLEGHLSNRNHEVTQLRAEVKRLHAELDQAYRDLVAACCRINSLTGANS